MIFVHIDPALVAINNGLAEDASEFSILVDRIVDTSEWLRTSPNPSFLRASDVEEKLGECGAFPSFAGISDLLADLGLTKVYAARDILRNIHDILARSKTIRDEFSQEVVSVTSDSDRMNVLFDRYPREIRDLALRALASVCFIRVSSGRRSFLISGNPAIGFGVIDFEGVALVDGAEISCRGNVDCVAAPSDLLSQLPAIEIWAEAEDKYDLHLAIARRIQEINGRTPGDSREMREFSIGPHFLESIKVHQAHGRGPFSAVALDVCAHIAVERPKYPVTEFGRIRSDGAISKRTHVTKGGVGLRLMYWIHPSGEVEFANLGPKQELDIYEGDPGQRCRCAYPTDVA